MDDIDFSLLELTLPTVEENLALDEVLLKLLAAGDIPATLRLWELPFPAVIVGRGNKVNLNVDFDACRREKIPVIRRMSGGGTVLLGPGCLVFTLAIPFSEHPGITESIQLILNRIGRQIQSNLEAAQVVELSGISDLTIGGLKFSGNSQRWNRACCLHHGTILYDFALDQAARVLTKPEREPDYRSGRTHLEFMTNLPLSRETIRQALVEEWSATPRQYDLPMDAIQSLAREKYQDTQWTTGR